MDRDCENCIHKVNGACNVWECKFEPKSEIYRPCSKCHNEECVFMGSSDTHSLCEDFEPKFGTWIPVSERLPKDFGVYLITLEGGDVCKCEFNPDFIDEEHENGAFTYYHQYFDPATLGLIDGEDEAVDAIAWMPFEPYDPQESEDKE